MGMGDEPSDYVTEYSAYLARFDETLGPCEFGAYAKFQGRLVKKLRYEEFETRWRDYQHALHAYAGILERGDTINDAVVKLLRERSDEFLLERPI
ncbi:MAG TPA: hypothetical protein VKE22_07960 [Haliangiales bacterium]|nr:hypothetical protein [Haliangiales bacterium]